MCEGIGRMAGVYREYCRRCLNEEERAEKEIEHSYLMLHLYWRNGEEEKKEEEKKEDLELLEYQIVTADLIISDTLKLLKSITNHDSLYSLMSKLIVLKGM